MASNSLCSDLSELVLDSELDWSPHRRLRIQDATGTACELDSHLKEDQQSRARSCVQRRSRGRPCRGCWRGARQRSSWPRCNRAHPTHAAHPTPPLTRRRSREAGIAAQKASAQADKARERKLQDEKLQEQRMEQRTRRLTKEGVLPRGS